MAGKQRVKTLRLGGKIADLLADPVGGFVGDAKLALEFFAAHAVARRAEQIHGIKPANQRRPRVVQDSASGGVHMMTAVGANERATGSQLVVSAFLAARTALKASATKPHLHDVGEAGVIVGKTLEELANRELRRGGGAFLAHANVYGRTSYMRQGDKRDLFLSILAMDSYNRGYGQHIIMPTVFGQTMLGNATIQSDANDQAGVASAAGFYAVAYDWNDEKVISYRGTNPDSLSNFFTDAHNGYGVGSGSPYGTQAELAIQFYEAVVGVGNNPFTELRCQFTRVQTQSGS